MRKLWALLVVAVVGLTLCGPPRFGGVRATAQVVPVPCGTPVFLPSPGVPVKAVTLSSELSHLETCAASAAANPIPTSSAGVTVTVGTGVVTIGLNNGNCLAIINGQEAYNCATPGPQATPSPTPTGCGTWTGVFPYTDDTTGCASTGQWYQKAQCALSASGTMPAGTHACKLTFTGITSMAVIYAPAYSTQAYCVSNDETSPNTSRVTVCGTGSATITATSSDVVDFFVTGF